jgi:hypothetical protein
MLSDTVLEFLNNLWGARPSRNRVVVPAHQSTYTGGIDSLELVLGFVKVKKFGLSIRVPGFMWLLETT